MRNAANTKVRIAIEALGMSKTAIQHGVRITSIFSRKVGKHGMGIQEYG